MSIIIRLAGDNDGFAVTVRVKPPLEREQVAVQRKCATNERMRRGEVASIVGEDEPVASLTFIG